MLHCLDCDYLKVLTDSNESFLCKNLMCEISHYRFLENDLYESIEYPCNKAK